MLRPSAVGAGDPGRWVRDIAGREINARWWGARGDGSTDDFPALQAAFDHLGARGGTLIIPPGDYLVSDHPRIQDKQPAGGMTIVCQGSITATRLGTFGGVLLFRNNSDLTWIGGIIDGGSERGAWGNNGIGTSGTEANGAIRTTRLRIKDATFRNCRQGPYYAGGKGCSNQSGNQEVIIENCFAYNCDIGFSAESTVFAGSNYFNTTSNVTYIGCTARDCTYAGLMVLTTGEWTQDPLRSGVKVVGMQLIDCGGMGVPVTIPSGSVDTSTDLMALPGHGYYSRSTVMATAAAGGISTGTTLWTVRAGPDHLGLCSSPGAVHNVLSTQVSPTYDYFIAAGPSWQTGDIISYFPQAGWSAGQHEEATTIGGLTAGGRYKVVKVGINYTSLVPTGTTIKTFGGSDISTAADTITITGHGFASGDPVKLSLGSPDSPLSDVPQLSAAIQGTPLVGVTGSVAAGSADVTVSSAAGIAPGDIIYVAGVRWQRGAIFTLYDFAVVEAVSGSVVTLDGTANVAVSGAAVTNNAGQSVRIGSTIASGNQQYLPETTYYVRAVDANTVALHRSEADALAGTNTIDITTGGSGSMGLVPPSDLVDITSAGTGLHVFARLIDITSAADTTLYRDGFAPVMLDRATGVTGDITISQRAAASIGPAIRGRGRKSRLHLDVW
ncbi:MAG TPA: hypothetical protein DDW89_01030, partial [Gammaproteobacteria bacterium]|nr:hypothetical protein [Gammaproteobacteria bacterium]